MRITDFVFSLPGMKPICKNQLSRFFLLAFFMIAVLLTVSAQPAAEILYAKDTKTANRERLYKNLVNNAITKNLSYPLTDSTEENWMDAFNAMELIRYKSPWTDSRIHQAFDGIENRSDDFQRSLVELVNSMYPSDFSKEVARLLNVVTSEKTFAMCAEYTAATQPALIPEIKAKANQWLNKDKENAIIKILCYRLDHYTDKNVPPSLREILHQSYFKNAVVVYSFQRKNRNYPGLVIVRDSAGNFLLYLN
jgi:hypothetical protein